MRATRARGPGGLRWCAALAALGVFAAGCGGPPPTEPEALIERYFEAVREERYDDVLALYMPKFFEKTPRDGWRQALVDVRESLGELQSYRLQRPLQERKEGPDGSYRATLVCIVQYSRYKAEETITVFKAPLDGPLLILEHGIRYLEE